MRKYSASKLEAGTLSRIYPNTKTTSPPPTGRKLPTKYYLKNYTTASTFRNRSSTSPAALEPAARFGSKVLGTRSGSGKLFDAASIQIAPQVTSAGRGHADNERNHDSGTRLNVQ